MTASRCLLVGGSGFLGRNLATLLAAQGHDVTVLARPGPRLDAMRADLPALKYVASQLDQAQADLEIIKDQDVLIYLVHSAQRVGSTTLLPRDVQLNLPPLLMLLHQFEKFKPKRVIFISSGGTVYGIPQRLPISEDHPTHPISSYGAIKLAMEHFVRVACAQAKVECAILRLSNPFGPGQEEQTFPSVIVTYLTQVIQQKPLEVWGHRENARDYLYVSDACRAIALAVTQPLGGSHCTLNIGSGVATTLGDLIRAIETVTGKKSEVRQMAARPADLAVNFLDVRQARNVLGFTPEYDLSQGLAAYYSFLLNSASKP